MVRLDLTQLAILHSNGIPVENTPVLERGVRFGLATHSNDFNARKIKQNSCIITQVDVIADNILWLENTCADW